MIFAALFLAGGSLLIGATYILVDLTLPSHSAIAKLPNHYLELCKQILYQQQASTKNGTEPTKGARPIVVNPSSATKCKQAFGEASKAGSTQQRGRALNDLLLYALLGLLATTILAGGIGWILSGRVLRPVRAITGAARRASQNNLGERLEMQGPDDELKELADTFDSMLGRLDQSFEGQRLFVANASHELRTPLTSMRTALDVTLSRTDLTTELVNELGERLRRQISKSDQIIEALLTLSISHQHVTRNTKIDLLAVVANTMDDFEFAIEQRNLRAELDLRPADIMGDQVLIERLVANLVDNAVRHNVDGGWVRVETGSEHDTTFISVTNSGTPIAEESLDNLIEPFNRVEARLDPNGGVGLGLTLVSSIATAHNAVLRLERLDAGGLSVRLDFGDS